VRICVRHIVYLVSAALLAGCSAGTSASTTSRPVTASPSSARTTARATATAARATATPPATASPGRGLLGLLPVPAGATPARTNTNALLSLKAYVQADYSKSVWTEEEALNTRRGFVSAVTEGWTNADGSEQAITLARFATRAGVTSALDEVIAGFKTEPEPETVLTDPAIGAVGYSSPTLDSYGYCEVEWGDAVGDTMILVAEYTAATPDPASAKALMEQQYDRLKNGS
jgi:hypothetical protein